MPTVATVEHRESEAGPVERCIATSVVTEQLLQRVVPHQTGVAVVAAVQLLLAQTLFPQPQVVTVAQDAQHQSREPLPHLLAAVAVAVATAVAQATLLPQAA
jgi:hypothetical protein